MAEKTDDTGFNWDNMQDFLFGVGGLAVSYKEAGNKADAPKKDLPPPPSQQLATQSKGDFKILGIDFSEPKNIFMALGVGVLAFIVVKD